jgi:hypothetical protein
MSGSKRANRLPIVNGPKRREVATRLRALLAGQDGQDLGVTAERLGVDEVSLRMSIDEESPYPTLDVLVAFVATYGVDPKWLLSGEYDAATHRRVLDADAEIVGEVIQRMASETSAGKPLSPPPDEPRRLHLS